MSASPRIGTHVRAQTTTPTAQSVVIEVTAIEAERPQGWLVWGHRQYRNRRNGVRQTMYPQLYLVPDMAPIAARTRRYTEGAK